MSNSKTKRFPPSSKLAIIILPSCNPRSNIWLLDFVFFQQFLIVSFETKHDETQHTCIFHFSFFHEERPEKFHLDHQGRGVGGSRGLGFQKNVIGKITIHHNPHLHKL